MNRKKKICTSCGRESFISSHGRCKPCAAKTYKVASPKKEPTGELQVFQEIWDERPHFSFISGKKIYEFNVSCFAHVLSKGMYKRFRLNPDNIVYLTPEEHYLLDFGTEAQRQEYQQNNPSCNWKKLYELREKLKEEYNYG